MEQVAEDQSHYEISLTAGQAFVAFVLMLLSLAASFAFGLMIGKGQADDRLVVRKDPAVVNEAAVVPKKNPARVAELGVKENDFKPTITESSVAGGAPPAARQPRAAAPTPASPSYAQLLSTSDQKTAEGLAAKLIEGGFTAAYVERTTSDKGAIFRVRVKFASEGEARAAETKLKGFSKEVWITR
jgi:cell division septation protein DedD